MQFHSISSLVFLCTASLFLLFSCSNEHAPCDDVFVDQPGIEEILSGSLIPGHDEQKIRKEHALAGELARTLQTIEGVEQARVHLALADKSLLSRDPNAKSSAVVVARVKENGGPVPAEIKRVITAAVDRLKKENVEVFLSKVKAPEKKLVKVGPIEVVESSAAAARGLFAALLIACVVLAVGLVFAGWRLRQIRRIKGA